MIIPGAILSKKIPFSSYLCGMVSIYKCPFLPSSVYLSRFSVMAYNMYVFQSRFAVTANSYAAPAKICGISSLIFISCAQLA